MSAVASPLQFVNVSVFSSSLSVEVIATSAITNFDLTLLFQPGQLDLIRDDVRVEPYDGWTVISAVQGMALTISGYYRPDASSANQKVMSLEFELAVPASSDLVFEVAGEYNDPSVLLSPSSVMLMVPTVDLSGAVLDGYVAGATIYLDANGNGVAESWEKTTLTTDANGRFSGTVVGEGALIAVGGINTDTGLTNALTFSAPSGSGVISPLTTLVQAVVRANKLSAADASAAVSQVLGLPGSVDLLSFDPLAVPQDSAAVAVQKANVQVALTAALGGEGVVDKVAGAIGGLNASGKRLDLSDALVLGTIAPEVSAGVIQSISGANAEVKAAGSMAQLAATQKTALVAAGRAGSEGDDRLSGVMGDERIDGGGGVDVVRYGKAAGAYALTLSALGVSVKDKVGGEGTDTLVNIERVEFSDKTIRIDTKAHNSYGDLPDALYQFFVVGFGAAPGVTYMEQMAGAYSYFRGLGLSESESVRSIVEVFTTKSQFTQVYPQSLYRESGGKYYLYRHDTTQEGLPLVRDDSVPEVSRSVFEDQMALFAEDLVRTVVMASASEEAKDEAIGQVKEALGVDGVTFGQVIYTVFGNLAAMPQTDQKWGATARQFANQVAVSKHYTDTLSQSTDDVATLRSVMAAVTNNTDVSSTEAIASLIGVALLNGPGG